MTHYVGGGATVVVQGLHSGHSSLGSTGSLTSSQLQSSPSSPQGGITGLGNVGGHGVVVVVAEHGHSNKNSTV